MSTNTLFIIELIVFNGVVLAWAGYELWSVRKRKDDDKPEPASRESSARDPRHPEG